MQGTRFWRVARRVFAIALSIFVLLPVTIILITSFTNEGFVEFPPRSFGFRWYVAAFQSQDFVSALIFSLEIAVTVAALSGAIGVASALVLGREKFPGRDVITGILMMPIALPHIVIAIGLLNLFAIIEAPSAPWGIIAGHLLITIPYVVRLTMASLAGLDRQLERASSSLGATAWQTLRLVLLPMIAPGAMAGVVFAFLLSFDEVTISLFTSLPGHTTLPAEIFTFASQGSDPVITAVSGIMIFFAAGLVLIVEHFFGVLRLIVNEQVSAEGAAR